MSDYDNWKNSGKLDQSYGSLIASRETIDVLKGSSTVTKEQYEKLADKFEQALQIIELQKTKISELESKKLPTKEDVESMSAMLDLLGKLDENTVTRINKLGKLKK